MLQQKKIYVIQQIDKKNIYRPRGGRGREIHILYSR